MKYIQPNIGLAFACLTSFGEDTKTGGARDSRVGQVTSHRQGLHDYTGYSQEPLPKGSDYGLEFSLPDGPPPD